MKLIDNTGLSYLIGKIKTMIGLKADKTYVDNKVKTDVPAGAVFTDTVYTHPTTAGNKHIPTGGASGQVLKYSANGTVTWQADRDTITTINGKAGAITKADIIALGIPAQDTVYSHPTSHPASMITGLPTSLPADGGNADTVGGFTVGTDVPAGAVFTDTPTDISGKQDKLTAGDNITITNNTISATDTKYTHPTHTAKANGLYKVTVDNQGHVSATSAVAKADITALGIPAQDTVVDISGKQDKLTAGNNITITNNTISATDTVYDDTSIQTALDGKAASSHTHTIANVTNLQSTLDGKAASSHTHTIANVTNLQTTLNGKAPSVLYGSTVPSSLLPGQIFVKI